ncbi:amylo-alpha-1,6-glucosidase [Acidobacteriota bacterium]
MSSPMTISVKIRTVLGLFVICVLIICQGVNAEVFYPWKDVYIGSFDADKWGGLVFVPTEDCAFAFHIRVKKGEETAQGLDLLYLVSEVGPHSPDCQYARVRMDLSLPFGQKKDTPILKKPSEKSSTMTFEWSRQDERTVIGKISVPEDIEAQIIHYSPWNFNGNYQVLSDGQIKGSNLAQDCHYYMFWSSNRGEVMTEEQEGQELIVSHAGFRMIYFIAGVDKDERILKNHFYRYKNERTIEKILREEEKRYKKKRVVVNGLYKGVAHAITNNLFWMTLYQPGHHRLYTPAGRSWIFPKADGTPDHWTIFEWDSFFNALEVSIESTKHAKDILLSVLETQYPSGNIPNWRGRFGGARDRSQPPVGSYVVLKYFQKTGDLELLQLAYPRLVQWHSFWKAIGPDGLPRRDGNNDGLLEWGSDAELITESGPSWEIGAPGKTRAMWESGQDDLPNWDNASFSQVSGTLTMNCVDLSSLYALDSWCLAEMAQILDKTDDHETFLAEYEFTKKLVDENLWDEKEGFYFDRHWSGQFSKRKAASNFYPLLAKIPDETKAIRLKRHLLNENEYWGEYILPTISRDDVSFKDQQYWRGTIWPPTNYLVYQGLKAYGFDAVASEFAQKSAAMFLRTWENFQLCPENYDSRTGEAGGERHQSWGPLFALIAVEEFLDFTPWEGFRFGSINPEKKGKLSRVAIQGRHYDVEISRGNVKLWEEGKEIISANGSAVFRHFLYSKNAVSFEIKCLESREVKIRFLTKGEYELILDNKVRRLFKGNSYKMEVPEGEHTILILLIDEE